jgi:hypothetical protein
MSVQHIIFNKRRVIMKKILFSLLLALTVSPVMAGEWMDYCAAKINRGKDIIVSGVKDMYDNTYMFTAPPKHVYSKHARDGYDADSKRLAVNIDMTVETDTPLVHTYVDYAADYMGTIPNRVKELPARIKAFCEPTPLENEIWARERRRREVQDREGWERVQRGWDTVKSAFNRVVGEPRTEEAPSLGAHEKYKMMKGW